MNTTSKWLGIVAVAFVAGSFIASPELRAYAANTVFSTDIVDGQVKTADLASNSVTSAKITDGTITAADLATDSVGSSEIIPNSVGAVELKEVSKLLFAQCRSGSTESNTVVAAGGKLDIACSVNGVDDDDSFIANLNHGDFCFEILQTSADNGIPIDVTVRNDCSFSQMLGPTEISIIVFDK